MAAILAAALAVAMERRLPLLPKPPPLPPPRPRPPPQHPPHPLRRRRRRLLHPRRRWPQPGPPWRPLHRCRLCKGRPRSCCWKSTLPLATPWSIAPVAGFGPRIPRRIRQRQRAYDQQGRGRRVHHRPRPHGRAESGRGNRQRPFGRPQGSHISGGIRAMKHATHVQPQPNRATPAAAILNKLMAGGLLLLAMLALLILTNHASPLSAQPGAATHPIGRHQ